MAAAAAVVLRLPGLDDPVGYDEAGFLVVARWWDPQPDSVYGRHFVDRPPLLMALFKLAGAVDGTTSIRLLGAAACGLLVLAAAATARQVAGDRAAPWVAASTAAITTNPLIDPVDVKGELLGLPLVMAGCWLSLLALRRHSPALAALAGLSAGLAVGLKQSLLGGLVFAAVLLVASRVTGRLDRRDFLRLSAAGLAGALLHPLATVGWAWWAGVELDALWYAVAEFRSDASDVLAARPSPANQSRAVALFLVALLSGLTIILCCFVALLPALWRRQPALTCAIAVMGAYDAAAIVVSGSFWRDYLFALVPVAALAASAVVAALERGALLIRVAVGGAVLSTAFSLVTWFALDPGWLGTSPHDDTGRAIAAVSLPGDTLTVFGGHADVQLASGLPSPYTHLWSLPMRTLDPELAELATIVSGPRAPTWLVQTAPFETWQPEAGARLRALVEQRYERVLRVCGDSHWIWRLRETERLDPTPSC